MRPAVVWFQEALPMGILEKSRRAVERADVLLVVGTSSLVHPAAGLAEIAFQHGVAVVEVNPDATPLTPCADFVVAGSASQVLKEIAGT